MAEVQAIPEDRKGVVVHLIVDGAQKALDFYAKAFDAKTHFTAQPLKNGKLLHAEFEVAGSLMYLADDFSEEMPGGDTEDPSKLMPGGMAAPSKLNGTSAALNIYVESVDATIDKAVAAGATVVMPPEDMFWGDRFGQVMDPFGHVWAFSTHIRDVTEEEMAKAHDEFEESMGN